MSLRMKNGLKSVNLSKFSSFRKLMELGTNVKIQTLSMVLIEATKAAKNDIHCIQDIAQIVELCMDYDVAYLITQRFKLVLQILNKNVDKYCQYLLNNNNYQCQ